MRKIEPRIIDILNDMRIEGCAYVGGDSCCCKDAKFFETCYMKKKEFLTRTELTKEEEEEAREYSDRVWNEIDKILEEIFD